MRFMRARNSPKRIGTRYYKKALYTPGTLLVNPADVLRGLYTTLPENVDVFEECPVMRIEEGTRARVTLLNGKEITAKTVIVTGGPFMMIRHRQARVLPGAFVWRVHPPAQRQGNEIF